MDIKAVLRNVRNRGLKWTWGAFVGKRDFEKIKSDYSKYYIDRPFLNMNEEEKAVFFKEMSSFEKDLKKRSPHIYDEYLKDMKREYVKKLIPAAYAAAAKSSIDDKVIFMEMGKNPSPSNHHISNVMKSEGKYDVHMTSLNIRSVSYLEFYENALGFIKDMATAKAVFLSTANDLMSHIDVRPETKVIQLWHGVGIFKKVGYSTIKSKQFGMSQKTREEYDQYKNYSYVTIAASEQSWIFEEAMNIDKDSGIIVPVGVAKTDVFYDHGYIKNAKQKLLAAFPQIGDRKIILYAPTFRGEVENAQAPDKLDVEAMAKALGDEYILLIKHHGLSKNIPPLPAGIKDSFAYDMNKTKTLNIEQLLAISDICITDYSSIAFEFAIMERPLIFFAYDLEEYIDERGLYYNYDEITPGPVCKTTEEMIDYISNIDSVFDRQRVIDFKTKHVNACDGHSTERTIALIEQ